jgi:hypothetical protein
MTTAMMNAGKAELELLMLDDFTAGLGKEETFTWLLKSGVPVEVATRMEDLWSKTKILGDQVIHLGRIIIFKIIEFIKNNPHTAIGMLLGAAFGALVNLVPFLGTLLAPTTTVIGAVFGGLIGARIDNPEATSTYEAAIILARKFFYAFAELLKVIYHQFSE